MKKNSIKNFNKKWFNNENGDYYECLNTMNYRDEKGVNISIAIVFSGRNRRKSFNVSARLLEKCWRDNKMLAYIRRYDKEINTESIEGYFRDKEKCVDKNGKVVGNYIEELTDGLCNCITYYRKNIYFTNSYLDENSGKMINDRIQKCGTCFSMSVAEQYKSLQYPDIIGGIFEEFLTNESYIENEPNKLLNLVSTISRGREDFTLFMIANTISRINPYISDFGLTKMRTQKQGTIDYYKIKNGVVNVQGDEEYFIISCEYMKDKTNENKNITSKTNLRTITNTNNWEELKKYNCINISFFINHKEFATTQVFIFESKGFKFKAELKNVPINLLEYYNEEILETDKRTMPILYISRKSSKTIRGTRCYTDTPCLDKYSTYGFKPNYHIDDIVNTLLKRGWVVYADNLTANEFNQVLKELRNL